MSSYENHKTTDEDQELSNKDKKLKDKGKRTNFKKDLNKIDIADLLEDEFFIDENMDQKYFQ